MDIGTHLKRILKEKGMTQKDLADKLGVTQSTISQYCRDNVGVQTLQKMASALNVYVCDLLGEEGRLIRRDGFVYIPSVDVTLSAGNGSENLPVPFEDCLVMTEDEFRLSFPGVNPRYAIKVRVVGDSMMPTFMSGDWVLVDTSRTQPMDGLFAITIEGQDYVKRLQRLPGNRWEATADNHYYRPIPLDEYSQVIIRGLVFGAVMVRRT